MVKPRLVLACLSAACVLIASPAYAWFGEGWLEKLSGPGPFRGPAFDARLVCLAAPDAAGRAGVASRESPGWHATFPGEIGSHRAWFSPLGCHFLDRDQSRLEFGFQYSRMSASGADNLLDYSHRPDVATDAKKVQLNTLMLTVDVRVNRVLDVGGAIGRAAFSSEVFGDFSKTVIQPVRVTVRPLSALTDAKSHQSALLDSIAVRFEGTKFNGGFRGEEFGARPGTYTEPGEFVWGWTMLVDLSPLFWKRQ